MRLQYKKLLACLLPALWLVFADATLLFAQEAPPPAPPAANIPPTEDAAAETPPDVIVKKGVPQGFEQLSGPQQTGVDVYFGGNKIGTFRAVFTPRSILFGEPEELVNKIPALKHDEIANVQQALTGELPTQAARICGHLPAEGCGVLKPDVAAVIFYEDRFSAELFVNPSKLELQDTHTDRILPPAPKIFSAVHQFNGNVTGADSAQEFSLLTNSTIAYGPQRLNLIGIASNRQKQINTFTASLDKWGLDNQAGLFNSHPLQLLPQTSMAGVSVSTSLKTNLALRNAPGNNVTIFLPQRSYVSLIYNNIIYSTDIYDAGNQVLNTSSLPDGAYELTIRVRTLAGVETEEKRFFAKTFAIPPIDQPIYFGQVGTVRDTVESNALSGISNELIATFGMIRRLTESAAINTDLLVIKDKLYAEVGTFLLLPVDHQVQASLLASSNQDFGFGGSYLGYFLNKKVSLSNNARIIFGHNDSHALNPADLFQPIQGDSRQWTTSLSYQMTDKLNIGLEGNYSDSQGLGRRYAFGPRLRYDFWRNAADSLSLTASSASTERGMQQTVFLNFTMRLGAWGMTAQGELAKSPSSGADESNYRKSADTRVTWSDDKDPSRLTIIGAEARHTDAANTYITDLDHRGAYGNLKLIGSETQRSGAASSTFYSGNFGFSVAHTAHEFAWGGNNQDSSGLILKNVGNSVGVPMKVTVDNSEKTTFRTGESTPLFLSPYQTYKVSIKPVQSAAIDYDGSVKDITLYPGNIMPLIWDINRINVVLGHVVLPGGKPLANARLEEARNISITDEAGMFQGEVLSLKSMTFKLLDEDQSLFKNQGIDDFTLPPVSRSYPTVRSNMSLEDQRKAILDIFDTQSEVAPAPQKNLEPLLTPLNKLQTAILGLFDKQNKDKPAESAPAAPVMAAPFVAVQATEGEGEPEPEVPQEKKPEIAAPAPAPVPAPVSTAHATLRCRVTPPEIKEENGVYIYPEPLVCVPISGEEPKEKEEPEKKVSLPRPEAFVNLGPIGQNAPPQELVKMRGLFDTTSKQLINYQQPEAPRDLMEKPAAEKTKTVPAKKPQNSASKTPARSIEVQVGSYRSEGLAKAARDEMLAKSTQLATKISNIIRADLGSRGIYYRLRFGSFSTKQDANDFCKELSAQGNACILSMLQ